MNRCRKKMSDPMLKNVNIAIVFVAFERSLAFKKRSLRGFPVDPSAAKWVHLPALASGGSLSLNCDGVEPGFVGAKGDPLDRPDLARRRGSRLKSRIGASGSSTGR